MAASQLIPANGAVNFVNSLIADFGSFEIGEEQGVESVASYGAAVYDPYRGSGTPHQSINCAGFCKGHANSTAPFGSSGGLADADGGAATFTVDTNHTVSGTYVIQSVRLMHARLRAAIPVTWTIHCAGDITTTWATS